MKILHTFILIALAANVHSSTERIVGGVLADPNAIPYQVALLPRKVKSSIPLLCGGSLVSAGAVLTAAHCLKNTEKTFVSIGAHNLTDREKGIYTTWVNASDYRVHPHFNLEYAHNDIALVILRKIVEFSDQIKHVALPSTDESFAGEIGTVSGFGNTCDDCGPSLILKVARNKILENEECSKLLGTIAVPSSTQICTTTAETKSGICRGDSGKNSLRR